jgi:hypothetical protein
MNTAFVSVVCEYIICVFLGLIALKILVMVWRDEIDLTSVISEANGDASMSRLQLLIFTFVIAISFFYLVLKASIFPGIPDGVLTLLGISASTYAVGKGISYSRDEGVIKPDPDTAVAAAAQAGTLAGAATGAVAGAAAGAPAGAAAGAVTGAVAGAAVQSDANQGDAGK